MAVDAAQGRLAQASAFYHEVLNELRKVTWPDRAQLRQATLAIIVFVLVIGGFIALLDVTLNTLLVRLIPSLFGVR